MRYHIEAQGVGPDDQNFREQNRKRRARRTRGRPSYSVGPDGRFVVFWAENRRRARRSSRRGAFSAGHGVGPHTCDGYITAETVRNDIFPTLSGLAII
jgi:hypothetical protein